MMPNSSELTVLDVGHGQCVVLKDRTNTMIFDAGPGSTLLEFLGDHAITSIDAIVISHADADHISGLITLLAQTNIHVHSIYVNADATKGTRTWTNLRYAIADAMTRDTIVNVGVISGMVLPSQQPGVDIEVLAPDPVLAMAGPGGQDLSGRILTANSMSVVVRINYDGVPKVIIAGDLDEIGLQNLLQRYPLFQAEILIFPHHGGRPSNSNPVSFARRLCLAVQPSTVIFSIGRGQHRTPRPDIVHTILGILPEAHIACTQLSEHCAAQLPVVAPTHLISSIGNGHRRNACCAGSIRLLLGFAPHGVLPSMGDHHNFISTNAPSALCLFRGWPASS